MTYYINSSPDDTWLRLPRLCVEYICCNRLLHVLNMLSYNVNCQAIKCHGHIVILNGLKPRSHFCYQVWINDVTCVVYTSILNLKGIVSVLIKLNIVLIPWRVSAALTTHGTRDLVDLVVKLEGAVPTEVSNADREWQECIRVACPAASFSDAVQGIFATELCSICNDVFFPDFPVPMLEFWAVPTKCAPCEGDFAKTNLT